MPLVHTARIGSYSDSVICNRKPLLLLLLAETSLKSCWKQWMFCLGKINTHTHTILLTLFRVSWLPEIWFKSSWERVWDEYSCSRSEVQGGTRESWEHDFFLNSCAYHLPQCIISFGLPWWLSDKESPDTAGDTRGRGLIPVLGRSPGVGNGNWLQDSCLENAMDWGA